MAAHSTRTARFSVNMFLDRMGRYFQIRDDYQNLISPEVCPRLSSRLDLGKMANNQTLEQYAEQKGFCEDLDEGKYSLPLIHLIRSKSCEHLLHNILAQRRVNNGSTAAHKRTILTLMERSGSLTYTKNFLSTLQNEIQDSLDELEVELGAKNMGLRELLEMLKV